MDGRNGYDVQDPTGSAGAMAVADSPADGVDLRLKRIVEYLNDSLARSDAFQATLGAANSDCMHVAYRLKQAIDDTLGPEQVALADFEDAMPAINLLLKFIKQAERISKLEVKLSELKADSSPIKALQSRVNSN